ncbi:MAG: hypothetical protein A2Y38_21025 [Spirochaetes bacterium GWB1_59_5]|nr:MAG: hypothetical protein A2Y38_21025 [Spirochaetes bacterium GWB1_59_5]
MKLFRLATIMALVIIALAACAMPAEPERKALVYGISRYDVSVPATFDPNLTWTDEDAISMSKLLSDSGWMVTEGIADSDLDAENLDASRNKMLTDIESLKGFKGTVLFYYSGHGFSVNGDSMIIPYGTAYNSSQWIKASELYTLFESAELSNVIIILDSCYSGGFVFEGATVDAIPPIFGTYDPVGEVSYTWFADALGDSVQSYVNYEQNSKYVVISAAGAGELSWESSSSAYGSGHGIFTYFLLQSEADRDADFDGDGLVTTGEAFAYCVAKIDATWNTDNATLYDPLSGTYADYLPHLSGTAREYALWATE